MGKIPRGKSGVEKPGDENNWEGKYKGERW